jgi:SAM-dependent methyltransferase
MHFDAEYDAAINMFSSLGYHRDESNDIAVVSNMCRALKPAGKFIIEMDGREVLARDFREREWYRHEDGTISLHERTVVNDWELLESRWVLIRGATIVWEGNIVQRIYSGSELRRLLDRAGLGNVILYGGLDGSRYNQSARRLVAVATR